MSLYGYPREPEASGDDSPDSYPPLSHTSSEPFAVPSAPAAAVPPAPLLPSEPPGFAPLPYPSDGSGVAGFVPSQRRTSLSDSVPAVDPAEFAPPAEREGFTWLRPPSPDRPDPGSPTAIGQPALPVGQAPAFGQPAPPATSVPPAIPAADLGSIWVSTPDASAAVAARPGASDRTAVAPARAKPPAAKIDVLLDESDATPWDRRPLFVVIAATVVLVLIGVAAGFVTATFFETRGGSASWRDGAPLPGPSEPVPAPGDDVISLSAVGDMIIGSYNFGFPPNDGAGFYDPVREALAADLVMGNLEQVLTEPTGYTKCGPGSQNCYAYAAPPSYANVVREAGFDLVTVNNNHTNDYGPQGMVNTRAALDAAGVEHTGGVDEITYVTVDDIEVGVIGFAWYDWGPNLNDIPDAVELVERAAAEADLVVIQFHGGAEGEDRQHVLPAGQSEYAFGDNRGDLRTFAHAVVDAGADLVIGHGPHVMRGMEYYQGRLIAYSLGNFCGYRALNAAGWRGVGGILKVSLNRDGTWASGHLVATEMVSPGTPAIDTDLRALGFVDNLSVEDFGAAGARIDHATGEITVPV